MFIVGVCQPLPKITRLLTTQVTWFPIMLKKNLRKLKAYGDWANDKVEGIRSTMVAAP